MDLRESTDFRDLIDRARRNKEVLALILFGSYARGDFRSNSDIDLCIIGKKGSHFSDFSDLKGYSSERMDVVLFDNMSQVMRFKVLTEGEILYVDDFRAFREIRKKFVRSYLDYYPAMKRQWKRMLKDV